MRGVFCDFVVNRKHPAACKKGIGCQAKVLSVTWGCTGKNGGVWGMSGGDLVEITVFLRQIVN